MKLYFIKVFWYASSTAFHTKCVLYSTVYVMHDIYIYIYIYNILYISGLIECFLYTSIYRKNTVDLLYVGLYIYIESLQYIEVYRKNSIRPCSKVLLDSLEVSYRGL